MQITRRRVADLTTTYNNSSKKHKTQYFEVCVQGQRKRHICHNCNIVAEELVDRATSHSFPHDEVEILGNSRLLSLENSWCLRAEH